MAVGVPVVALESSAVTETMGGAGVLLHTSQPEEVSEAVRRVMTDSDFRNDIIWKQDRRLEKLTNFDVRAALTRVLDDIAHRPKSLSVQIQGPIETSYSLAILNREAAFQLASQTEFDVSVFPTEGPGDYPPRLDELASISGLSELYEKGLSNPYPDVVIRQMFPPRVKDTTGSRTLQYFGWEESLVPHEYARDFNEHVHRIMTMSSFVKEALQNSGVTIPIDVVGVGVRTPTSDSSYVIEELQELKRIRLLHISSAFPRKGVDVLLNAYFDEFNSNDDITLILKTFPNQHNTVEEQLSQLVKNHPEPPHVVLINRDLPVNCLGNLYEVASAYVHTARGEGFGLPVAEAMLAAVPVISTATSGLADFVDESTATVIPSFPVNADTHVSVPGSQWFEPDAMALRSALRSLYLGIEASQRASKAEHAKDRIERDFSWEAVGQRIQNSIRATLNEPTSIKVTHLTTFNSRCGIAEYSALLQQGLPNNVLSTTIADRSAWPIDLDIEEDTVRLWDQLRHQDITPLVTSLQLSTADVVHLQYNFGFFSMEDLSDLINQLHHSKPIVVTLHRTKDLDRGYEIVSLAHAVDALRKVSAIIVHEQHDVDRLAQFGITENVHLIPHAAMPFVGKRSDRVYSPGGELRIGTFGFLLPHKGLEASLTAVHSLNQQGINATLKALCSLHPDPSSVATHDLVNHFITQLGLAPLVSLDTSFKTVEEIHTELSDVDVLALPYSQTQESSSGVLAMLLAIGKPIIATDLDIFSGARESLIPISAPAQAKELTTTLAALTVDPDRMTQMGVRAQQRALEISWGSIGQRTTELYQSLLTP
jgi:glycosyltransferase involved in cell wall biosynthesis